MKITQKQFADFSKKALQSKSYAVLGFVVSKILQLKKKNNNSQKKNKLN